MDKERSVSNDESENISDSPYLQATRKMAEIVGIPEGFEVSVFTLEDEKVAEDRRHGIKINQVGSEDLEEGVVIYPNVDAEERLVGFTHSSKLRQALPEPVMDTFGRLAQQIDFETQMNGGLERVVEGNDYSNWEVKPKPPLGEVRELP